MNGLPPVRTVALSPAWVVALVALGAGFRIAIPVFDLPWNTAPLMAMAFGGAMMLGVRIWWVPAVVLVVSDLVLGVLFPGEGVASYTLMSALFYLAAAWLGSASGRKLKIWPMMWCGTLLCGVLFSLVANTYSWAVLPGYAKDFAGWWQSQTTGLPGFPPAWIFLRNSLIADSLWCGLAGIVYAVFRRPQFGTVAEAPAR